MFFNHSAEGLNTCPTRREDQVSALYRKIATLFEGGNDYAMLSASLAISLNALTAAAGTLICRIRRDRFHVLTAVGSLAHLEGRSFPFYPNASDRGIWKGDGEIMSESEIPRYFRDFLSNTVCEEILESAVELDGRMFGGICILSEKKNYFSPVDARFLRDVALYLAMGLDNRLRCRLEMKRKHFVDMGSMAENIADGIQPPLIELLRKTVQLKDSLPEEARENLACLLSNALQNIERIAMITHDLRLLSNVCVHGDFSCVRIKINKVVQSVCDYLKASIESVALFKLDLPENEPEIFVDESLLWHVLSELIKMSLTCLQKYFDTQASKNMLEIVVYEEDRYVVVSIGNYVQPLDPAYKTRFFEPFTFSPIGTGKGMGLTATWNQVYLMGGTLEIDARQKDGNTLILRFPAAFHKASLCVF